MKNIAVFVSGGGTDLQSVIDAAENGEINGNVKLVVSNKENIYALKRAEKHNIETAVFKLSDYKSNYLRDEAICSLLNYNNIDLVVFAGYLAIVTDAIVKPYEGKIINIHPSLIPKHCGKGYYGLKVHQSVIDSGDEYSGATVHYVDGGADTGQIIEQVKVKVLKNDTAETLQSRVLEAEHKLLPKIVAMLCEKE